ncbi:RimJ/RimL family protein N-acetyltransferase [Kribbella amoyensis]|uniref:RimJ/RimL family protein N-acetyltransferase n=1 Tax=Kribbella amoyensis TaxID=996641 RepID=A0A561BWU6_9ACTN|nr:GNAT family protein [Kribbella amoyensis]TWD83366.1 RimJ/RimL family protein N-acetyltransferase [Kribbella amoyensis]
MTDFSHKPTLAGERVILRPLDEADFPMMRAAMADPEVARLTWSQAAISEEKAREWLRTRKDQPDRLDLAIVDKASGESVGEAVLNEYDPDNLSCNFRILIGPGGRDRGLGTEATRMIVGYGIEELGLHRISLGVYAFNPRAQRAYEKAGFVVEGRLRDELRWEGEWVDSIVMSVLAPEWKAALRSSGE